MKQTSTSMGQRRTALPPANILLGSDPLLTAREAAAYRRQGMSTFWRDVKEGLVRRPIYITSRGPRWHLSWLNVAHDTAGSTPSSTEVVHPGSDSRRSAKR